MLVLKIHERQPLCKQQYQEVLHGATDLCTFLNTALVGKESGSILKVTKVLNLYSPHCPDISWNSTRLYLKIWSDYTCQIA